MILSNLKFYPLTQACWPDFENLLGPRGACGGCWCMWWRLTQKEFERQKGEANRQAMFEIVKSGHVPGILAYLNHTPVGWCSVAPREAFPRLNRSKILKPVDNQPVWSIVCLFVDKRYRHQGLSTALIKAAVDYVKSCGGKIVEAYAVEPAAGNIPEVFAYHGLAAAYRSAGFKEVARRSPTRPIMRFLIDE